MSGAAMPNRRIRLSPTLSSSPSITVAMPSMVWPAAGEIGSSVTSPMGTAGGAGASPLSCARAEPLAMQSAAAMAKGRFMASSIVGSGLGSEAARGRQIGVRGPFPRSARVNRAGCLPASTAPGRIFGGAGDDLCRNARAGRLLVPVQRLEVVAHELLVVAGRADADAILLRRPEARGIRRQHLVHHIERAVGVGAELELGVGDDDAALGGIGRGPFVDREGGVAHPLGERAADGRDHLVEADILVVIADRRLGRGREDRLGQLLRLAQAGGQLDAAQSAGRLVVLPARSRSGSRARLPRPAAA